jgi:hypothetical protein
LRAFSTATFSPTTKAGCRPTVEDVWAKQRESDDDGKHWHHDWFNSNPMALRPPCGQTDF